MQSTIGAAAGSGHELRLPEADVRPDGSYELWISFEGVHCRVLYFLNGDIAAVVSHGIVKERVVPFREIE